VKVSSLIKNGGTEGLSSNWPVQVTENLALFRRGTYPKLKQQLQCRYPKHDWR
jgi:hypothetical protein